jgi:hypothetical protein
VVTKNGMGIPLTRMGSTCTHATHSHSHVIQIARVDRAVADSTTSQKVYCTVTLGSACSSSSSSSSSLSEGHMCTSANEEGHTALDFTQTISGAWHHLLRM